MEIWLWVGFLGLVFGLLALDLGVFHKKDQEVSAKEALAWTGVWVICAFLFSAFIYWAYSQGWMGQGGGEAAARKAVIDYLTGYVIEKSLSLDNIFVIAMLFSAFKVPGKYQHRILFWGILGALVMRAAMIFAGTAFVRHFDWALQVFGAFLVITALKMLFQKEESVDIENNKILKFARRVMPVTSHLHGHDFFSRLPDGRMAMTPLFLVLLLVESTDVLFAVDSIPAIFSVTTDPFIVFTSNVFAILGLRSLYFALAAMMDQFRFLKYSLVFVLAYVGIKMLISHWIHIHSMVSLAVIVIAIALGIGLSQIKRNSASPHS